MIWRVVPEEVAVDVIEDRILMSTHTTTSIMIITSTMRLLDAGVFDSLGGVSCRMYYHTRRIDITVMSLLLCEIMQSSSLRGTEADILLRKERMTCERSAWTKFKARTSRS